MKARLVLVAVLLAACQSWQAHAPEHPPPHRGAGTGAGSSGGAGSGTAAGSGEHAGMHGQQDVCALHRQIASARTPAERQALVEQAMPDMPQESRERHLQMMQQMCQ